MSSGGTGGGVRGGAAELDRCRVGFVRPVCGPASAGTRDASNPLIDSSSKNRML
jgi:hypothetical protein